ncbi:MAG: hypothetical protein GY854_20645, partial [Deltaproteobacteria bacterium]|nr:hypothetical protein [Deltaproteobacteria bacterium]
RELALAVADVAENPTLGQSSSNAHLFGMISRLLRLYRLGIKKYPESLVMRLNFVRVALHLGSPHHASEGLSLCKETLQKPETTWKIDAMEDVFPYDFFSQFFNYRAYFDSVTEHLKNGAHVEHTLICLIMASLHHYAGHYVDALPHFQAAVKLDPAFFRYKLSLARALLSIGDPQDRESAKKLLLGLADDSWLFGDAYRLLEQNWPKDFSTSTRFKEISNVAAIEAKTVSHSSRSHPFDVWGASPLRPIKSD